MPTTKQFSIEIDNQPGTLGEMCRSLADRGVNIVAFELIPSEGTNKGQVRLVVDNPTTAKSVLDNQKLKYTETQVAQVKLANQVGELARVASKLGEADVNIDYAYCGVDPGTNEPLVIFGVADAGRAAKILDDAAAAATA
jgi:hypothetical protein